MESQALAVDSTPRGTDRHEVAVCLSPQAMSGQAFQASQSGRQGGEGQPLRIGVCRALRVLTMQADLPRLPTGSDSGPDFSASEGVKRASVPAGIDLRGDVSDLVGVGGVCVQKQRLLSRSSGSRKGPRPEAQGSVRRNSDAGHRE